MKDLTQEDGKTELKEFTGSVSVSAKPHPLKDEVLKAKARAGQTLYEVLGDINPQAVVFHNGVEVPHQELDDVVLAEEDVVNVAVVAHGGDNGNKALRTVLQIAITAATLAVDVVFPGAGRLLQAGIAAVVAVGGNLLVNALVPPSQIGMEQGNAESFENIGGLTGSRNRMVPYGPVPRVYGRHKMFPPMAAKPFTEVQSNVQFLHMLLCVGYGPVKLHNPKIGETSIGSFDTNNNFTPNGNFENIKLDVAESPKYYTNDVNQDNVSVTFNDLKTATRTTAPNTDEAGIDFLFPQGLFAVDKKGDTLGESVGFKIEYREAGTTDPWINPFESTQAYTEINRFGRVDQTTRTYEYVAFDGNERETLRDGVTIEFPSRGQYEIRVERVSADANPAEGAAFDDCTWTALKSLTYEQPVDLPGCVFIGLRIKATDQLTGVLERFNLEVESRLATYSGGSWDVPTFDPATGEGTGGALTSNPAWAFADVLAGDANARSVDRSKLDGAALESWANYCNTEGFEYNSPGDNKTNVYELAKAIAASGRASFGVQDGLFTAIVDREQTTPVQMFTPRNSWNFSATRRFPKVPHAIKVRFIDPTNNWQENERIVYDDGYNSSTATRFEVLELPGVTDPDQAWKMGRYYLAEMRLRPETYTFEADVEHIVCFRGDKIRVSHDVPLWGIASGRIKSVTTDVNGDVTAIEVDEICTMEAGKTYAVTIRTDQDFSVNATVVTNAGENTTLTLSAPIDSAKNVSKGDLFAFGEQGTETVDLKVLAIEPRQDLVARITAVDAAPAIHDADTGTIPAYDSQITEPVDVSEITPTKPTITNVRTDETTTTKDGDGSYRLKLVVAFEAASGFPGLDVEARYRKDGLKDGWTEIKTVAASNGVVSLPGVEEGQDYIVSLRTANGTHRSEWVDSGPHTVAGKQGAPTTPSGFTVNLDQVLLRADWDANPEPDIEEYEIRKGSDWATGTVIKQVKATETTMAVTTTGQQTFWIKAIDTSGNESATAASFTVNVPSDWLDDVTRAGGSALLSNMELNSGNPFVYYVETDLADKNWRTRALGGDFVTEELDDGGNVVATPVTVKAGAPDDTIVANADGTVSLGAQATAASHGVRADRSLTIQGTTDEIEVAGGTQDLTGNRTWTVGLPSAVQIDASLAVGGALSAGMVASIIGDAEITGNVDIGGTINYVNEDNLQVEDKTITVNKNGTDGSAEGAGLIVERPSGNKSLLWDSNNGFIGNDKATFDGLVVGNANNVIMKRTGPQASYIKWDRFGTIDAEIGMDDGENLIIDNLFGDPIYMRIASSNVVAVTADDVVMQRPLIVDPQSGSDALILKENFAYINNANDKAWHFQDGAGNNEARLLYSASNSDFSLQNDISGHELVLRGDGLLRYSHNAKIDGTLNSGGLFTAHDDIYPNAAYASNIGAANKKFLSLHAAELRVSTLVAAEERATTGGRFLVGRATELTSAVGTVDSSIEVKHNNLGSGDVVQLEGGGQLEFMQITSAASGTGPYTYSVTRNLDGTGANAWEAGDGVFNTGQTGEGFIDLYAVNSVTQSASTAGPTIAHMVRTGSGYNAIEPRAVSGNLKGHFGIGVDDYGFAAGDPSGEHIVVNAGDGISLFSGVNLAMQINADNLTVGNLSYDVSADTLKVANWTVDPESIHAGGIYLWTAAGSISSQSEIRVSENGVGDGTDNYVNIYYNSDSDWGIKGFRDKTEAFFLGEEAGSNHYGRIAGWEFSDKSLKKEPGPNATRVGLYSNTQEFSGSSQGGASIIAFSDPTGNSGDRLGVYIGEIQEASGFVAADGISIKQGTGTMLFQVSRARSDGALTSFIAGWNFDNSKLYSGNMEIAAAGSIRNTAQINGANAWALLNDGSGYVAGNNVRWSTNGIMDLEGVNLGRSQENYPNQNGSQYALSTRCVTRESRIEYVFYEDDTTLWVNGEVQTTGDAGDSGSFNVSQGDIVQSNRPTFTKDGDSGHLMANDATVGKAFAVRLKRNAPHTLYIVSFEGEARVDVSNNSSFTDGATFTVGQTGIALNNVQTVDDTNDGYGVGVGLDAAPNNFYIRSDKPISIVKTSGVQDRVLVMPHATEVLCWSTEDIYQLYGGLEPVESLLGRYHRSRQPLGIFYSADGAGSDQETGIPYEFLGDNYMVNHAVDGYIMVAIEPCTVKAYNSNGFYAEYDLTNASRSNPVRVDVGDSSGGGTHLDGGATNWRFVGTGRFYIRTNDVGMQDEYAILGYDSTKLNRQGQTLIRGGYVRTGKIVSTNWTGATGTKGSMFDLDSGILQMRFNSKDIFKFSAAGQTAKIAGFNFDNEALFSGSKVTSGYTAAGEMTITAAGTIHTENFYLGPDGSIYSKKGDLQVERIQINSGAQSVAFTGSHNTSNASATNEMIEVSLDGNGRLLQVYEPADTTAPDAPSISKSGTWVCDSRAITWNDVADPGTPSTGTDHYNVYRRIDSGSWQLINSVDDDGSASFTYTDNYSACINGKTFYYYVTAVDGAGNESNDSNVVSGTVLGDIPRDFDATFFFNSVFECTWDAPEQGQPATDYELQVQVNYGNWNVHDSNIPKTATNDQVNMADYGGTSGDVAGFRLRANDGGDYSDWTYIQGGQIP